jgi:cyclophilin family peptidyl-prolyl cis-trans isomerase
MNAISRLFDSIRQFSNPQGQAPRRRRRRQQPHSRLINGETLEPKQLLAVDLANLFADQTLATSAPVTIAITNQFDVTDVLGTVVKFETNAPVGSASGLSTNDFYVELYDKAGAAGTLTPETVGNFLSYVSDGSYDNTKIHRSVSDFVIQGGGFTAPSVAADQPGSDPVAISTKGTITNEPGNSNLRGTLAMAKLGGLPNSATSQWFVNLSDNTFLDTDNGGYAVFGEVLGDGMTVVDVMGTALTYDATTYYSNGAFSDLPLWNVNADNIVLPDDFVKIETITELNDESELMTYTATTSDTSKLAASINAAGDLVLTPVAGKTGSVSVTVTATSKTDGRLRVTRFRWDWGVRTQRIPFSTQLRCQQTLGT